MGKKGLEFFVGLFLLIGLICLAYLSLTLGDIRILGGGDYRVRALFSNVAGLTEQAPVTMAGVDIGKVEEIQLEDQQAVVTLRIDEEVRLEEDVIASIKTLGLIGEKYISLSPGASDEYIKPGGVIRDTLPPLDVEELLGKFVFGAVEKEK